jgi:DNA-binding transcriptional LysR family regulator
MIRITNTPPVGLIAQLMLKVEHVLCATPKYLATHPTITSPHDLLKHSCFYLAEQAKVNHWRLSRRIEIVKVFVDGRYVANHSEIRLDGVLSHLGVGCMQDFVAKQAFDQGLITRVLPDWEFLVN